MRALYLLAVFLVLLAAAGIALHQWLPPRVEARLNPVTGADAIPVSALAREIHEQMTIVDLHADPLLWQRDLLKRGRRGHVDLPRLQAGNVALQVFGLVTQAPVGMNYQRNSSTLDKILPLVIVQGWPIRTWGSYLERALYQSGRLQRLADRSNDRLMMIRNQRDLDNLLERRAQGENVVGGLLGLEGAHALDGHSEGLQRLAAAGLRMLGLAHFIDNEASGSAHWVAQPGLSPFGQQVIQNASDLGIVIDVAHASNQALQDSLRLSSNPVVYSHGGVRATCDNPRNLSDAQIRGIAATGGVIGIGLFAEVTCSDSLSGTVAAMRHVADLVGVEHIALGSDFNGAVATPIDASGLAQLTQRLLANGFDQQEAAAILGGNSLRVLAETLPE